MRSRSGSGLLELTPKTLGRLAAVLSLGLTACPPASVGPITLAKPNRAYKAADYERELKRWTRYGSTLRQLDTTLRLYATWRGPRFDAALVAKRQKMFVLPERSVEELQKQRAASRDKELTFELVAATHDFSWNDFNRRNSHWRLSLANDAGAQVAPHSIKLHRRATETDIALFPHLGKLFHQRYTVRFPRNLPGGEQLVTPQTKSLTLRAAGALGKVELVWKLSR